MSDLAKMENILTERLLEDAKQGPLSLDPGFTSGEAVSAWFDSGSIAQGPQTLRDAIIAGIEVYAENLPQTCLDSPTSRTMLADHLVGHLAVLQRAKAEGY